MTAPNMNDLIAQRAQIERQLAELMLIPVQAAKAALAEPGVTTLIASMTAALEALPEPSAARTQVSNVITVLTAVPQFLEAEVARLQTAIGNETPEQPEA